MSSYPLKKKLRANINKIYRFIENTSKMTLRKKKAFRVNCAPKYNCKMTESILIWV